MGLVSSVFGVWEVLYKSHSFFTKCTVLFFSEMNYNVYIRR